MKDTLNTVERANFAATFEGKDLRNSGIHRLVIATIKQAIADLKLLTAAGVIKDGKLSPDLPKDKRGNPVMPRKVGVEFTLPEAKETIEFFKDDNIGILLQLGGIEIEPVRFRRKLDLSF
jgi:hypothetical protein